MSHVIYSNNGCMGAMWQSDTYIYEIVIYTDDAYMLKKIVNSYYEEDE